MTESQLLQFEPFNSVVDPNFWQQLGRKKLDVYQLDQSAQPLVGWYQVAVRVMDRDQECERTAPAQFSVNGDAFEVTFTSHRQVSYDVYMYIILLIYFIVLYLKVYVYMVHL
jgi:hypothetical protein